MPLATEEVSDSTGDCLVPHCQGWMELVKEWIKKGQGNDMLKEERQALILNKLHSSGKVVVSRLAVDLNVSEDTIRRDLLDLDQKGRSSVFGGPFPWSARSSIFLTARQRMWN